MIVALLVLITLQFVPDEHDRSHAHSPAPHGGLVIPIGSGRNHFHAEAVIGPTGVIELYTLGADPFSAVPVEPQHLAIDVLTDGGESVPMVLRPAPESGPPDGPTTRFLGRIPPDLLGRRLTFRVPDFSMGDERFEFALQWQSSISEAEHAAHVAKEQQRLYLTPGGRYTEADINTTERQTAVKRYRGQRARRLVPAQKGERMCPVTRMKPDERFVWTVGGKVYQFCCPVCIDDFVNAAREMPESIKAPEEYVQ
jgi:hypothetical protein